MKYCRECKHILNECRMLMKPDDEAITDDGEVCGFFEPMTNFDNVTASPEALVEFLIPEDNLSCVVPVWCKGGYCEGVPGSCRECLRDWLKQEVEDEE